MSCKRFMALAFLNNWLYKYKYIVHIFKMNNRLVINNKIEGHGRFQETFKRKCTI